MIRVHATLQAQVLHCIVMHDRFYVVDQLGRGGGECEYARVLLLLVHAVGAE